MKEARVSLPGLHLRTLTDSSGRYVFEIPASILIPPHKSNTGRTAAGGFTSGNVRQVADAMDAVNAVATTDVVDAVDANGRCSPVPVSGINPISGRMFFNSAASPGFAAAAGSSSAAPVVPPSSMAEAPAKTAASARESALGDLTVDARGYYGSRAALSAAQTRADVFLDRDYRKQLWVWQSSTITVPAERKALLDFGAAKGIGTFYMYAEGIIATQSEAVGVFIDSAYARGCAVELLFGDPAWALRPGHAAVAAIAGQVRAFAQAQAARGGAAPTAMQLDVEAYSLDTYAADSNGNGTQWIEMYEKVSAVLRGSGVGVNACVPRWLDDRPITRNGVTRPLSEWIADASDRLTLMDYVDKPQPVIDGASREIEYAVATGKEVVVGVETMPGLDPPSVSFAEEGEAAMEATLSAVDAAYRSKTSYFGPAVHNYQTYKVLKP